MSKSDFINKATIQGRLGSDPEFKKGATEHGFVILSVATTDKYKNKEGKEIVNTEWHKVVVFKPDLVSWAKNDLKKGDLVLIEGAIVTEKWENENQKLQSRTQINVKRYDHKLELVEKKQELEENQESKIEAKRETKQEPVALSEILKKGKETFSMSL